MPEPTKPPQKPPHPFTKLCAARLPVVVQEKGGNIIRGRAKWHRNGFLKIEPATIIGKNREVNVPWVLVENQAIAHLHPDVKSSDTELSEEGKAALTFTREFIADVEAAGAPQPDDATTQEFRLGGTV